MNKTWNAVELTGDLDRTVRVGDVSIRVISETDRTRLYFDGAALADTEIRPGWNEISIPDGHSLVVRPRTPDLPVVLRPDDPISLAVGSSLAFEVLLPVWVELCHEPPHRRSGGGVLFDIPSKSLKRSWFGTPAGGEVSYSWRFDLSKRRSYQRHLISVPVTIRNQSSAVLRFERFLLRVVHLGVYQVGEHLQSNGVSVSFKGAEQLSQISFESDEDMRKRNAVRMSEPRERSGNDIIRKSFGWLRELTV